MVSYHLPCHWGASPWTARRRSYQAPETAWTGGDSSSQLVRVRSDAQRNLVKHRDQWREGNTAPQTVKNPGSNSDLLPRRQKGRLITSQRLLVTAFLGWNHVSQFQGVGWKYCAVWEYMKIQLRHSTASEVSEEFLPTLWLSGSLVMGGDGWKSK
jgi:hypothetical protein